MKIYKKQYFFREIIFMIIAMGAGTLFHFIYEWSGFHPLAGLFAPVNESTWEHLKMLFFPVLLLTGANRDRKSTRLNASNTRRTSMPPSP